MQCTHTPSCPTPDQDSCLSAKMVADHNGDQGWELLCNGVILFDDGHALLPGGRTV